MELRDCRVLRAAMEAEGVGLRVTREHRERRGFKVPMESAFRDHKGHRDLDMETRVLKAIQGRKVLRAQALEIKVQSVLKVLRDKMD